MGAASLTACRAEGTIGLSPSAQPLPAERGQRALVTTGRLFVRGPTRGDARASAVERAPSREAATTAPTSSDDGASARDGACAGGAWEETHSWFTKNLDDGPGHADVEALRVVDAAAAQAIRHVLIGDEFRHGFLPHAPGDPDDRLDDELVGGDWRRSHG